MVVFEFIDNIYFLIVNKDSDFYTEGRYIQDFLYNKNYYACKEKLKLDQFLDSVKTVFF